MTNKQRIAALTDAKAQTVSAYEQAKKVFDLADSRLSLAKFAIADAVVNHSPEWVQMHKEHGSSKPAVEAMFDPFDLATMLGETAVKTTAQACMSAAIKTAKKASEGNERPTWAKDGMRLAKAYDAAVEAAGPQEPTVEKEPTEITGEAQSVVLNPAELEEAGV